VEWRSMKRVLAAHGKGKEVEKRRPEEERDGEWEGGDRGGERGEEVGALCACKTSSRLSRHEESTYLSTIVALCIFEMIFSICDEGPCRAVELRRADSRLLIGEISGDSSAPEEEGVEEVEEEEERDEDKEEEGGVSIRVEGGGICKRGLRAARRATEAWREAGNLASL